MSKKRLFWQLVVPYLLITLALLGGLSWYVSGSLRDFYLDHLAIDLEARAQLLEGDLVDMVQQSQNEGINALANESGVKTKTRFTVILPGGKVVGDSHEDPAVMDNHASRPEIADAFLGNTGVSTRYSATLQQNMMYVGRPLRADGKVIGVVRAALPVTAIHEALERIMFRIALGVLVAGGFAVFLSFVVSHRISKPLRDMKEAAELFANGDFGVRLPPQKSEEVGGLADSMNWMAAQLDEKIQTIERQANEQEAVLSSMVEGVLAVDANEHIIHMNRSAADLVAMDPEEAEGKALQEVVRNSDLQRFVKKTLASQNPMEGDLVFHNGHDRFLQVHGTILRDAHEQSIGALIVLHDVTKLRRLENVRRDFVANVSHELRTPITSIKGFVETLQDGASEDPEAAQRFLKIVARQADRLNAIVEDLLSLSRIEQGAERGDIPLEGTRIRAVLEAAIQTCRHKAKKKDIELALDCDRDLATQLNAELLEQAVVNLIDNAIKYSDTGSSVRVQAVAPDAGIAIAVQDHGCGITAEHLPRLFERFYRVDKARSREMGGTGLGLAIVKHIAQAHGGTVGVESEPGKGSTFTICLPRS
jgi:two-component system phosphate regulon sensor histidine kinase PhoR